MKSPFSGVSGLVILAAAIQCGVASVQCSAANTPAACNVKPELQKIDALLKQKRLAEAHAELKRLNVCRGLTPLERFTAGWFFGRTRDFQESLRLFRSVPTDVPDRQTHLYAVALSQFELADFQGVLDTLAGQGSLQPQSVNLLAVAYSKLGRYTEAYGVLTAEIEKNASDRMAYLNLITLLCDAGNAENALKVVDQAVTSFPGDAEMLVVRGATYTLLGKVEEARSDFASAIQISPRDASPRFLLAVSDYKKGDYQTAIADLAAGIQLGIRDADLHYLMAECMLRLDGRDVDHALAELNTAISLNPRHVSALALRGKLLLQTRRQKEAVIDLELAHNIDPKSRNASYNLARAYFVLGKKEEAQALMKSITSPAADSVEELGSERVKQTISGGGGPPL